MTPRPAVLLIPGHRKVAALNLSFTGTHYEGTISFGHPPHELKRLFEEFEGVVGGQMFSLLDDIEEKIGAVPFAVSFDDGTEAVVEDLQVFPSTGAVSFKTRQPTRV